MLLSVLTLSSYKCWPIVTSPGKPSLISLGQTEHGLPVPGVMVSLLVSPTDLDLLEGRNRIFLMSDSRLPVVRIRLRWLWLLSWLSCPFQSFLLPALFLSSFGSNIHTFYGASFLTKCSLSCPLQLILRKAARGVWFRVTGTRAWPAQLRTFLYMLWLSLRVKSLPVCVLCGPVGSVLCLPCRPHFLPPPSLFQRHWLPFCLNTKGSIPPRDFALAVPSAGNACPSRLYVATPDL